MASVSASTVVLVVGPPRGEHQAARADERLRHAPRHDRLGQWNDRDVAHLQLWENPQP
jgi:hypothetical protein